MARPATSTSRLLAGSREPVRVATTANINPAAGGLLTIDGVTVEPGDRVLVKNQADKRLNGIYGVSSGEWYRASDARSPRAINKGVTVHVAEGTVHEGQTFAFLTPEPVIGTDEIVIGFFLSYDTIGDAETAIEQIVEDATTEIEEIADDAVTEITNTANEAIAEVGQESAAAVARVVHEGDVQVARVEGEGNEQVERIEVMGEAITGLVSPILIAENTFGTKGSVELWNPETPPDYVRIAGYYTVGDGGGALYKRVDAEPTHQGKIQSADGTWWELAEPGELTLEMFGGKADAVEFAPVQAPGVTDNYAAFMSALNYWYTVPVASWSAGPTIRLLRGVYYVSQTIEIDRTVRISGLGGAPLSNAYTASELVFPINTTAFIFWSGNTPDPLPSGPVHGKSATGSIIECVRIWGNGGMRLQEPEGDLSKHGIISYTTIQLRECTIANFAGDGVHFEAGTVAVPAGSTNELDFYALRIFYNGGHGMFIDGADSSAGGGVRVDCSSNGGWGIWDSSFLGNGWINCHTNNNAMRSRAIYDGYLWYYVYHLPNNRAVPGTDATVWDRGPAGGTSVHVAPWSLTGTYIAGGPYCTREVLPTDSKGFGHIFVNCYSEGGSAPNRLNDGTIFIGGLQGAPYPADPNSAKHVFEPGTYPSAIGGTKLTAEGALRQWGARLIAVPGQPVPGENLTAATVMLGSDDQSPIKVYANGDHTQGLAFPNWNPVTGTFDINHGALLNPIAKITTDITTTGMEVGRGLPLYAGRIVFPNDLFVGHSLPTSRMISNDTAVPLGPGAYAQGDVVFNRNAVAGGKAGWICVQGGMVASTAAWAAGQQVGASSAFHRQHLGRFYQCTSAPGTNESVVEPTHTASRIGPVEADGYVWTFAAANGSVALPASWKTGTDYPLGKQISNTSSRSYVCTADPGAVASTVMPVHTSGTVTGADGYGWAFTDLTWVTGTAYALDDLIKHATTGDRYRCSTVGGGSSTVQPSHTTVAFHPVDKTKWEFLYDPAAVNFWAPSTVYKVGDIIKNVGSYTHRVLIAGPGVSVSQPDEVFEHKTRSYADGYKWEYVSSPYHTLPWDFGFIYSNLGDKEWEVRVRNAAGMYYWCRGIRNAEILTADPPVHTSGEVMGPNDFIIWRYVANQSPIWKAFGVIDA